MPKHHQSKALGSLTDFSGSPSTPKVDPLETRVTNVAEKIEMSFSVPNVANRGGYIIEAVRENYQDERVRKARQVRAEKMREQALEDLTEAFYVKRNNIVRQAIQADPMLIEKAGERVGRTTHESDLKNTIQPQKPIRKVPWSKSLLRKSLPTNSAKTASHPSTPLMRTKRHASWRMPIRCPNASRHCAFYRRSR